MDAYPHPLCSVTIKGEPDEIDVDLPFKTSLKTEVVELKETIIQEVDPESPKEFKYSPPVDLSDNPFCSVTVKSEPEELDTDLSFKTSPEKGVDDLKSEMPDDNLDGNSNDGTSPYRASSSLTSSSGGAEDLPQDGNLCNSMDEVIAPYLCAQCKSRFRNKCQLRSHLHSDHQIKSEDVTFCCSICNKIYMKRAEFMRHILEYHPRVNVHICPVCRETFHSYWDLHEHLSKYSDEDSYSCPICYQIFPTRTTLEMHMQTEEYTCKMCSVKFHDPSAHNQHMKSHTEEILTCEICYKSYSKRYAFVQHVFSHSKNPKFDCPKCEKNFATHSSLSNHLKVHSSRRIFTCETCNRAFAHRSHLVGHMATHAGVRSFTCLKCKKSFIRPSDLRRHEKIHSEG